LLKSDRRWWSLATSHCKRRERRREEAREEDKRREDLST
jgi:hypothetical protein